MSASYDCSIVPSEPPRKLRRSRGDRLSMRARPRDFRSLLTEGGSSREKDFGSLSHGEACPQAGLRLSRAGLLLLNLRAGCGEVEATGFQLERGRETSEVF